MKAVSQMHLEMVIIEFARRLVSRLYLGRNPFFKGKPETSQLAYLFWCFSMVSVLLFISTANLQQEVTPLRIAGFSAKFIGC
jgi:hypothetical protein